MFRMTFTFLFLALFVGCQKDQTVTESANTIGQDSNQIHDYIVFFKEERFSALNSLVTETNYESSFDVFQHEYDKIFQQAEVSVEQNTQTYIKMEMAVRFL